MSFPVIACLLFPLFIPFLYFNIYKVNLTSPQFQAIQYGGVLLVISGIILQWLIVAWLRAYPKNSLAP